MRLLRLAILLLASVMTVVPARPTGDNPPGFVTITHESQALGSDQTYMAYVPKDAAPGERFPVLYVLHGAYGGYEDWPKGTSVSGYAGDYRMILIFPDGGEFGWYVDSPIKPGHQYATYVAKELVADVDSRFPTIAGPGGRAIMGLSMGGHGAFLLSLQNPGTFGSASSTSGILKLTNHAGKWSIPDALGPYDEHSDRWAAHSVYDRAGDLAALGIPLYFDCGTSDTATGAITDNRMLHERLTEMGVPHVWREHAGGHSWDYWGARLREHMDFHASRMVDRMPGLTQKRRAELLAYRALFTQYARQTIEK